MGEKLLENEKICVINGKITQSEKRWIIKEKVRKEKNKGTKILGENEVMFRRMYCKNKKKICKKLTVKKERTGIKRDGKKERNRIISDKNKIEKNLKNYKIKKI